MGSDSTCQPIMPRRKPSPSGSPYLRRNIASAAARLMAEDGLTDYGMAKRKAARSLGMGDHEVLPTNEEVEEELRAYQELFQEDEHPERLFELRSAALAIMRLLAEFRPYLTGPVLDGTAGRYSAIDIDLYADSSKDVEISLLSRNISYEIDELQRHGPDAPETRLSLEWEGNPVRIQVFPYQAERSNPRNAHTGRTRLRARAEAVAELLKAPAP
jgi:hypothetical protein